MITRSNKRLSLRALIVDDELGAATAEGRAARALVTEMQGRAIEVVEAISCEDGRSVITSDSAIHALLIDCRSNAATAIPMPPADEMTLLVIDTGVKHDLAAGAYGERGSSRRSSSQRSTRASSGLPRVSWNACFASSA